MTSEYTESERRLRAIVRAFLSPGVWLVVGAQFLAQFALRQGVPTGESGPDLPRTLLFSALMMGFVYLQAGAYHGLAKGSDRLTLREVATPGVALFARFLWLFLKLGVSAALVFNLFALALMSSAGVSPDALVRQLAPTLPMLLAVLGLAFVYWLPLVFVTDDFRLFATWRRALRTAWQRLPQSGFLAVLLIAPVVLLLLLPEVVPDDSMDGGGRAALGTAAEALLLSLSALASLLGWIVYIYCVEWLRDHPPEDAPAAG